MENELDMEDIESRLYSQIHHSSIEDEQLSNVFIPTQGPLQLIQSNPYTLNNIAKRTTHRYFHKEHINQPPQPTYISFDDINSLQNNISISPISTDITTESNFSSQFQNNITVNQYTVPVIINSELNEVLSPPFTGKYFTSWAVQNQHLVGKKKKRSKKERNKEKKWQNKKANRVADLIIDVNLNGDMQRQTNEVICVSDDSDDECIIQGVSLATPLDRKKVSTGFPKKYNDNDETSKKPESDDDIIYIPPPPIEVVNIDADDKEQEIIESTDSSNCERELSSSDPKATQKELKSPESSGSNDFLDSAAIGSNTHKFDFALHGSDFNNSQAEFVRPTNPVDFCETESSCSTNELNREFHNSVKTVVFNEVEFPREDIFSENLEKFGTYITPKRNKNKVLDDNAVANSENTKAKDVATVDSSNDSSSESDYEHSKCVNRNLKTSGLEVSKKLPTLSPMLSNDSITPKKWLSKKKTTSELHKDQSSPTVSASTKKDLSKKKLVVNTSESDSDSGKETPKSESKKLQKKKKKKKLSASKSSDNCSDIIVDSDSRRKRKKKNALQNLEEEDNNDAEKSQNKKKKDTLDTNNSESGENTDECTSLKKKRRKSLRSELYQMENNILADVLSQKLSEEIIKPEDSELPRDRKKKNFSESDSPQNEESTDLGMSSSQKKKRKNSQELKTLQNDNIEASTSVHRAEETIRHKSPEHTHSRKKKVSTGSNSGQEENIDAARKKRRNRSGCNSPEKDNASPHLEAMVKKKKDRYLESITQPECTNQETVKEKPKKKKKSEKEYLSTDKSAGDEQQRVKKISFSELLDQPLDVQDRMEAEVQKKKKKKSLSPLDATVEENTHPENTHSVMAKSVDQKESEVGLSPPQENEKATEVDKQPPFDENVLGCNLNEIPMNPTNQAESSVKERAEDYDSDEELLVIDETDTNSPNLIVVDEAESTMINAEVVLSSDSEYDFKELTDVGKDLELVNCVVQGGTNDDSEEMIVVDDDSRGNIADRYSVDEEYRKFDVEAIHNTQTDDPEAWKISYKDRAMVFNRRPGPRCNRCRQFGHPAVRCTEKVRPPHCSLCGNPGHQEPRCPNKICRQCGNEGDYSTSYCWKCFKFRDSICKLCNMVGHIAKTCPDLWRRYHLTTKEGPLVVSRQPQLKPRDQLWCPGCAQQGHMEHECSYFREYPPITPSVVNYEDILHQEGANSSHQRFDRPSAVGSRSENVPMPPDANSQSVPTHSRNNASGHCKPKDIPSPQSQISVVSGASSSMVHPLPVKGLSQSISSNEVSSEKESVSSEHPNFLQNNSSSRIIPRSSVPPPSESQSVPSLRNVTRHRQTPAGINATSGNFTKYDYDNLLSVANPGLLGYIRSIQFGEGNIQIDVQPLRANMIEQLTGHLVREDQNRISSLLLYEPVWVVREFLQKEMNELDCWVRTRDPRFLIRQYFKYNKLSLIREHLTTKTVNDKCFWFRILNMYLFGVHQIDKGKKCMRLLQRFLKMSKPNKFNRKILISSHKQVFGVNKHGGVNYPGLIQQIIDEMARKKLFH